VVTGRVLRVGRRNAILEGRVGGADTGDLVATGQGVWRVFSGDS
jgi:acyl-coenzyme A thioesterase PaaI-like protein